MNYDILIQGCTVLMPDFTMAKNMSVGISNGFIAAVNKMERASSDTGDIVIDGSERLLMPGLVDAHTHCCQQLLRGRVSDEYPMRWSRFYVPFESRLDPDDVYLSAQLCCLEMIKSGTTSFADSGGVHMNRVADAVIESGMRAAIAKSSMDSGSVVGDPMKETADEIISRTEDLYRAYQGTGDGRIDIWFALRQVMTCSPELVRRVGEKAAEYNTGIHAHLYEHKDEVSFCLQKYKKRPAAFLDEMGVLGPNLLTAHNVVLSEDDITLMRRRDVKLIHCPRANLTSHGFSKTPRLMECGFQVGIGSDGAATNNLNLFDEIKVLRAAMTAYWGLPAFDPVVMRCAELLKMVTINGAAALGKADKIGSVEVGKKADVILLDISQPHLAATHNLLNTVVEAIDGHDVTDSIIDGKLVMRNRKVLTLDEEKIIADSRQRIKELAIRAGF